MKKKTIIAIITTISIILFSISCSFANNNIGQQTVDGIRNVVGGAENILEDAASGAVNGVKNVTHATQNTTSDVMNSASRTINNSGMSSNNSNYTASRTSTTTNNTSFFGMNSNTWAFLIMGILGIAIVALVWYYGKQNEIRSNHNRNDY